MSGNNTAAQMDLAPLKELDQDVYFLDSDLALQSALNNNMVRSDCGHSRNQICYYDGEPVENAPLNLINVPADKFTTFFALNSLPMPSKVVAHNGFDPSAQEQIDTTFKTMIAEIEKTRASRYEKWGGHPPYQDTYFLNARVAYQTALQQNRVFIGHPTITGLQVCYYSGPQIENAPENLIYVHVDQLLDYLCNCRTRLPKEIVFSMDVSEEEMRNGSTAFKELVETAINSRRQTAKDFVQLIKTTTPDYNADEPLSIYLMTDRRTTVLQYALKNLANSFEKLGHKTFVSMEDNEMEELDSAWHLKEFIDFKPNVTVNINHRNNEWLHNDIVNIIWYQDPANEILQNKTLYWRDRDIILSAAYPFDEHLYNCGAAKVTRQHFCVDTDIFHRYDDVERVNKAVFIGSSYSFNIGDNKIGHQVAQRLLQHVRNGEQITEEILRTYAAENTLTYDYVFWKLFHHAVREASVEWLCRQTAVPVEVYGRHWENNAIVAPYLKGELPHGKAVSQAYNSARYALVAHPFEINSQRLAEVSACGCIPVVYDCRHTAEPPHWDEECLFFSNEKQLQTQLQNSPASNPEKIGNFFTYDKLALRLIESIRDKYQ